MIEERIFKKHHYFELERFIENIEDYGLESLIRQVNDELKEVQRLARSSREIKDSASVYIEILLKLLFFLRQRRLPTPLREDELICFKNLTIKIIENRGGLNRMILNEFNRF